MRWDSDLKVRPIDFSDVFTPEDVLKTLLYFILTYNQGWKGWWQWAAPNDPLGGPSLPGAHPWGGPANIPFFQITKTGGNS